MPIGTAVGVSLRVAGLGTLFPRRRWLGLVQGGPHVGVEVLATESVTAMRLALLAERQPKGGIKPSLFGYF